MNVLAATSWVDAVRDQPGKAALSIGALAVCSVSAGFALRALTRRTRSLHHLVLAILLASLAVGGVAAFLLAQLMILDDSDARTIVGLLVVTAVFASVLAFIATGPIGTDAARLEAAVRRLETGDRTTRTGVRVPMNSARSPAPSINSPSASTNSNANAPVSKKSDASC